MVAVCKRYLQKARIVFCSLDKVHVRGKRGRQVSILINTDEIHEIETLTKYRSDYVNPDNEYDFAVQNNKSKAYLYGNDSMRKILDQVPNLEAPERVNSTELRKYCTTVSQIADLTENNLRWLADHMDHNLDVSRNYCGLKDSPVELSKVAKMLLAIDEGHVNKFAGEIYQLN